jgi:hypothetical protein
MNNKLKHRFFCSCIQNLLKFYREHKSLVQYLKENIFQHEKEIFA